MLINFSSLSTICSLRYRGIYSSEMLRIMSLRKLEKIAKVSLHYHYPSGSAALNTSNKVTGRSLSSLPEKGKQFFERFLGNSMKPSDNMDELLDREKEAKEAFQKAGLKPAEGDEFDEEEWVEMFNKETGEWNGPRYGEPTIHGDWQTKGRATDFK